MVGEVIGTGGKAIESNIIEKPLEFIKTLSEFVQLRGDRSITSGASQATTPVIFFTVPDRKMLFIFAVSLHQVASGVGNARGSFQISGKDVMLQQVTPTGAGLGNGVSNDTLSFSPPFIVRTGETLAVTKNNTNGNHISRANVTGYLLDSEVAGS